MDVKQALAEAERHALAGNVPRAEALVREVLAGHPDHAEALYMLGMFRSHAGDATGAEAFLTRAIAADPAFELAHASLGAVRLAAGRVDEAIESLRAAVAIDPDFAEAREVLAGALTRAGRMAEAAEAWDAVAEKCPPRADLFTAYAQVLYQVGRYDDGLNAARFAEHLDRTYSPAYHAVYQGVLARREMEEALAAMERLVGVRPDDAAAHYGRGMALLALGELDAAQASLRAAIQLAPDAPLPASMLLMTRNHLPGYARNALYREHVEWADRYARKGVVVRSHENDCDPERKLRVGFVSGDFRSHPVADFTHALFAHRDRDRFHLVAYSDAQTEDAVTAEFRGLMDGWRAIAGRSDDKVERLVRDDRIDILIDLTGHTAEHRLLVFARRPAPVQVTYIGYCDTTGIPEIDYIVGDAVTDPPGHRQPYAERLLHLPGGFACYMPPTNAPEVNALPALSRGDRAVTFGSLHKLVKLNDRVVALWSRVVRATPGSRLLIFRDALSERPRRRLTAMFAREGVDADRLEFRNALPASGDSMSVYNDIDVALDAFPWSGHTTACESMWMGVPMVTLRGSSHAGRMAASTISHAGRPEWVAEDEDQFVSIAAGLAGDPGALAETRRTLRERMRASRLCDGVTFTREFEVMLRDAWKTWCERGQ